MIKTKVVFQQYFCRYLAFQLSHRGHGNWQTFCRNEWASSVLCLEQEAGVSVQRDKFRRENVNFCCVLDLKCTADVKVRLVHHLVKRVHAHPDTHTHTEIEILQLHWKRTIFSLIFLTFNPRSLDGQGNHLHRAISRYYWSCPGTECSTGQCQWILFNQTANIKKINKQMQQKHVSTDKISFAATTYLLLG